ncbi:GLPGLI family protein [Telluribacter sp. SYSU D00476]|uniref:GLPGLI family protein n=1 Tax=Telluribacter sp. SYSU D00476 TaxID=2811430 RepID=UPI001FF408AA|nr:GLPGLI family protein [Telluribacter sp. SYSU D00476]
MKYIKILLLVLLTTPSWAQKMEGVVTYERVQYWTKIISRLTFLSQEEKDRVKMTWGNDDEWKTKMKLYFSPTQSKYTYFNTQGQTEDGNYSWRQDEYEIYRDFDKERKTEIIEMLGRTYLLEDSLNMPRWKIMNQIKDIQGHVCMMAVTEDTIRNQKITAWFADDIPVQAGPERYFGLPGLIMELSLNDGDVVITATNIEMKPVVEELKLPKKLKGRKITDADYDKIISTHIRDSIKSHRNPYWAIRY